MLPGAYLLLLTDGIIFLHQPSLYCLGSRKHAVTRGPLTVRYVTPRQPRRSNVENLNHSWIRGVVLPPSLCNNRMSPASGEAHSLIDCGWVLFLPSCGRHPIGTISMHLCTDKVWKTTLPKHLASEGSTLNARERLANHRQGSGESSGFSSCSSRPLLSYLSLLAAFLNPSSPWQLVNTASASASTVVASVLIGVDSSLLL